MTTKFSLNDMLRNSDGVIPLERLPGIYRSVVKGTEDPQRRARLRVYIPSIHPEGTAVKNLPWADCCSNVAGSQRSVLRIPSVDDVVYVMFDHGHRDYPVWMGSWWGRDELPTEITKGKESDHLIIKIGSGAKIDISEEKGNLGITIKTKDGSEVTLDDSGSKIDIKGGKATTTINIVPGSAGEINLGNNPLVPCNDLLQCFFNGAFHAIGTKIPGNKINIP